MSRSAASDHLSVNRGIRQSWHSSIVAFRRRCVIARFELSEPCIRLVRGYMQTSGRVVVPCRESILAELLPLLLALDILLDGFPHDPMRRTSPCIGKPVQAFTHRLIQLDTRSVIYAHKEL
jgi:hypothetical protein